TKYPSGQEVEERKFSSLESSVCKKSRFCGKRLRRLRRRRQAAQAEAGCAGGAGGAGGGRVELFCRLRRRSRLRRRRSS
ncbi:hypothetical protein NPIL_286911, partial [Nephila pilipes]